MSETLTSARRRGREALPAVVVALAAGVAGVAGSFAAAGSTPGFVVAPIAGFLARNLPAEVITTAIVVLGDFGERLNAVTALLLAVLLLAAASAAAMLAARLLDRRFDRDREDAFTPVALAALLGTVVAFAVSGAVVPSLAAGVASALVHAGVALAPYVAPYVPAVPVELPGTAGDAGEGTAGDASAAADDAATEGRRRVLASLAGALGVGVVGYLLGSRNEGGHGNPDRLDVGRTERNEIDRLLAEAEQKSLPVDGLESLVSETFYEVDINTVNPNLDTDDWALSVTGAVEEEATFAYEDLRAFDPEHRFVSLRCVGEQLNGRKMDNALWTGVPVMALLERAGLEIDECCVMLRAADDYYEEFPVDALRDGFVAYGMNGHALPRAHGFPVRALIPGHWGEISVKWLTEIEVLRKEQKGYWEERGWHGTGPVNTVAKLHAVNRLGGRVQVGGHAYAGTRDVSTVEVSTDGGETWNEATLSEPLPGEDVWRQWVYEYDTPDDTHEVVVRAVDGTGAVQPKEESGPFPRGPSGWVSTTIRT